jgi:hypothetical protein
MDSLGISYFLEEQGDEDAANPEMSAMASPASQVFVDVADMRMASTDRVAASVAVAESLNGNQGYLGRSSSK